MQLVGSSLRAGLLVDHLSLGRRLALMLASRHKVSACAMVTLTLARIERIILAYCRISNLMAPLAAAASQLPEQLCIVCACDEL